MIQIQTWETHALVLLAMTCGIIPTIAEPQRAVGRSVSEETVGGTFVEGSTIVSMVGSFQPELIYKKFPTDQAVVPEVAWQLSFGVLLESAAPSINVTLRLDPAGQNSEIQILQDIATFVPRDGLYDNYDAAERFELAYHGAITPFVGPVDFLLEPEGFVEIPVRVHLNVTDQPGFSVLFSTSISVTAAVGDITGDGNMEIVIPGDFSDPPGLYAFDQAGNVLPGWPFRTEDPDVVSQNFATPAIVDLDGDGQAEVVVVGQEGRNVGRQGANQGTVWTRTLYALEGSGLIRWEVTDDFELNANPAIADLDGDSVLDIVIGVAGNLRRFDADGVPVNGWQVETLGDMTVSALVIADVDNDLANGMEIIASTPLPSTLARSHVYVWNEDGSLHSPAWPIEVGPHQPPTVLDLDLDPTNGREIVVASYHGDDPPVDPDTGWFNTFSVYAWHADGSDVSGWPHDFLREPGIGLVDDRVIAGASAGDVDGDGDMEVVVGTYGQGAPENGNLFLFHHDGTLDPNWPQWAGMALTPSPWGGMALGDLDGDGQLEIVTGSFRGAYVFRADGRQFEGFPRLTVDIFAQPTIADLDGDGRLEIVAPSVFNRLHVWHLLTPSPDPLPWPRYRQNSARTGAVENGFVPAVPTISEVGLAIMCGALVGVGILIIRRYT